MEPRPGSCYLTQPMRTTLAVLTGALLAACGGGGSDPAPASPPADAAVAGDVAVAPDLGEPDVTAPDVEAPPPLPNTVGYATFEVTTAGGRVLPVAMWYPARPDATGDPELYLALIAGTARRDAPVADGGPWPLLVFSHGNQGMKEQSVFLTEYLAAHGYVVVAPDHVGNTFTTFDKSLMAEIAHDRPGDISACIDRVTSPEKDDPGWWKEKIDPERIGALGHSFGGYTTLALAGAIVAPPEAIAACAASPDDWACQLLGSEEGAPYDLGDPRIDAAMPMSPAGFMVFRETGLAKIAIPTLILTGAEDTLTPLSTEVQLIFDAIPGNKGLWVIQHAGHFTFSDICALAAFMPADLKSYVGNICDADAPLLMDDAHALIDQVAQAFFDAHLKGDAAAKASLTKEGAEAASSEITMTVSP